MGKGYWMDRQQKEDLLHLDKDMDLQYFANMDLNEADFYYGLIIDSSRSGEPLPEGVVRTCSVKYADAAEKFLKSVVADYVMGTDLATEEIEETFKHSHKAFRIFDIVERAFPDMDFSKVNLKGLINKAHNSFSYPLDPEHREAGFTISGLTIDKMRYQALATKALADFIHLQYELVGVDRGEDCIRPRETLSQEDVEHETAR